MNLITNLIISIVFISIIGTLSHFIYDWTNHKKWVGIFVAVNESVWEHVKMALIPCFLYSLFELFFYFEKTNFIFAILISLLLIILIIPIMFYIYKLIFKKHNLFYDILTFYIAIFSSSYAFYYIMNLDYNLPAIINKISFIFILVIYSICLLSTLAPIKSKIFKDPINNEYGFDAHKE